MSDSDNIYKDYKPPVSDGIYFNFEDGHDHKVRILSDPACYISTFGEGENASDRMLYAWLVWNFEAKKVQVMKLPVTAYRQIAKYGANDDYGDPRQYNLTITRTGQKLKTVYDIIASPEKKQIPEQIAVAAHEVDLFEKLSAGKGVSNVQWLRDHKTNEPGGSEEEVPANVDLDTPPAESKEDADW